MNQIGMNEEERICSLIESTTRLAHNDINTFIERFWCYTIDRQWSDEKLDDFCHYILDEMDSYPYVTLGAFVKWRDPGIKDYPPEDREEMLNRKFKVIMIDNDPNLTRAVGGSIVLIGDGTTEAEVPVHELMPYES